MKTLLLMIAASAAPLLASSYTAGYTLTQNATLSIFDSAGAEIGSAPFPSRPLSVVFSQDGTMVWAVGENSKFYGIAVATKTVKAVADIQAIFTPVLSPDGTRIYALTANATLVAVDPTAGTVLGTATLPFDGRYVSVAPDSAHVYVTNTNVVYIIDAASMEVTNQYAITGVEDIAALPDNQTAAIRVVNNQPDQSGPIMRLNLATGETTTLTSDVAQYFILSPGGKTIFSLFGGQLTLVDVATGQFGFADSQFQQGTLCASPNGAKLYGTTGTGLVTTDLPSDEATSTVAGAGPYACAVSPDSTRVWMANSQPNEIDILNVGTGKLAGAIEAPVGTSRIALTPDGSTLFVEIAAGPGTSSQIAVLNTATGLAVPQSLNLNPVVMAVSPDGTKLVVAGDLNGNDSLSIVDVASLTVTSTIPSPLFTENGIVFSPDSSRYYVGGVGFDGTAIAIYDSTTNNQILIQYFPAYDGELTISPDGSTLYAGQGASTVPPAAILEINAATLATIGQTGFIPVNRGLVVSLDGSTLYAIGAPGSVPAGTYTLSALSTSTLTVVASTTLVENGLVSAMVLSPSGTALYLSQEHETIVVNTADLSVAATLNVASGTPYLFGSR